MLLMTVMAAVVCDHRIASLTKICCATVLFKSGVINFQSVSSSICCGSTYSEHMNSKCSLSRIHVPNLEKHLKLLILVDALPLSESASYKKLCEADILYCRLVSESKEHDMILVGMSYSL